MRHLASSYQLILFLGLLSTLQADPVKTNAAASVSGKSLLQDSLPDKTPQAHEIALNVASPQVSTSEMIARDVQQECDFDSIEKFFDFAYRENLNITAEVQSCQNLCLMTYGNGNPDLSGIGMMHAYNLQTAFTVVFGPVYRALQIVVSRFAKVTAQSRTFLVMSKFQEIQTLFFASNGFFILSSAVASLVRLAQNPTVFEIAEMQALAFLHLNSLLVTFFCLARPISRLVARVFFTVVVAICVIVVLAKSQLSSRKRLYWQQAAIGCEHGSSDFGVIKPVPYPPSAVVVFGAAGVLGLCLRSIRASFQGRKRYRILFDTLMVVWTLLIGLMTAGMVIGLVMVWRQRNHLRIVVGIEFEDDTWGFGQVAAMFIWAPIPVEVLLLLNGKFAISHDQNKADRFEEIAIGIFPWWSSLYNKCLAHYLSWQVKEEDESAEEGPVMIERA